MRRILEAGQRTGIFRAPVLETAAPLMGTLRSIGGLHAGDVLPSSAAKIERSKTLFTRSPPPPPPSPHTPQPPTVVHAGCCPHSGGEDCGWSSHLCQTSCAPTFGRQPAWGCRRLSVGCACLKCAHAMRLLFLGFSPCDERTLLQAPCWHYFSCRIRTSQRVHSTAAHPDY